MTQPSSAGVPLPTRRGLGVAFVLAFAFAMAWSYGLRSLHAIMVPLAVLLIAAVVTVVRADVPDVRRRPVDEGFIGERRTVEVAVDVDRPVAATVHDAVGDGLAPADDGNVGETMLAPDEGVAYDVRLERRGAHPVGPLAIDVTDALGLVRRRVEDDRTTSVVVYPRVYDLRDGNERDRRRLADVAAVAEREEFDHLREYARGDPVRLVHWKSAAKRPDDELLTREFEDDAERGAATVAAECIPGREDEMAAAAASVATYLLRTGVSVGLALPDDARPPGRGRDHHRELLGALAVAGSGELDARTRRRADVLVQADASGTIVVVDEHEIPFDRLRGSREDAGRGRESGDRGRERGVGGREHNGGRDRRDARRSRDSVERRSGAHPGGDRNEGVNA